MEESTFKLMRDVGFIPGLFLILLWGLFRAARWTGTNVLKPIAAKHIELIDSIKATTAKQAETLAKIADTQEKQADLQEVSSKHLEELTKGMALICRAGEKTFDRRA